jgi:hypothetical protein
MRMKAVSSSHATAPSNRSVRLYRFAAVILAMPFLLEFAEVTASGAQGEIVHMAPVKVKAAQGLFDVDILPVEKTKRVQQIKVSWVSSKAHDQGFSVGDQLTFINGTPVSRLSLDLAVELLQRTLTEAETQHLEFTHPHLFSPPTQVVIILRG